jgi:hypothetical protein
MNQFALGMLAALAMTGSAVAAGMLGTKLDVEQFLVGVNYKFNFGGPVVARY